ncbi:MAG: Hsp20/alpha crystallin family protein [Deltaproteobacteria bacterium]|nr:Hsp20/alpha crystallin family protein [Deltaproteobacteria bacterium]
MFTPVFYRHANLMDQLRRMFEESSENYEISSWPLTNVFDNGESLILMAEIPGVKKDELDIEIVKDVLTLKGERRIEYPENVHLHRRERSSIRFHRSYNLPYRVDGSKIIAELENGVLKLVMPKHPEEQAKKIQITSR